MGSANTLFTLNYLFAFKVIKITFLQGKLSYRGFSVKMYLYLLMLAADYDAPLNDFEEPIYANSNMV